VLDYETSGASIVSLVFFSVYKYFQFNHTFVWVSITEYSCTRKQRWCNFGV